MSQGGYVPYMVLADETIVTHTCHENENEIKVYFEQPDDEFFFKYLEIKLLSLENLRSYGFEPYEVERLMCFTMKNREQIIKYAKVGGIEIHKN